jgi:hypothetical protein
MVMSVIGEPVTGPIPSFNVQEAVIVPVEIEYASTNVETVIAYRPDQLVEVKEGESDEQG